jgi:hypothetical protein
MKTVKTVKTKPAKKTFVFRIVDRDTGHMLYQWDATFTDHEGRGFESPIFAMSLVSHSEEQLKKLVDIEIKPKGKAKK